MEGLVAVSRGVAKRFELSTVAREEFPKVTTVTRDEAAYMVAAGKLCDEADGWRSQPQLQTTIPDTGTFSCDEKLWSTVSVYCLQMSLAQCP